jgi:hypothetical protein
MSFTSLSWGSLVERVANICVIRKPRFVPQAHDPLSPTLPLPHAELTTLLSLRRNWYNASKKAMFRGLKLLGSDPSPKLVYVVDGERMERSKHYQERVRVTHARTHHHAKLHTA